MVTRTVDVRVAGISMTWKVRLFGSVSNSCSMNDPSSKVHRTKAMRLFCG